MRLLLHIGTPKTGTTGLQAWAKANRSALADAGIWFPLGLGAPNHRMLALAAQDPDRCNEDDSLGHQFDVHTPAEHRALVERASAEVAHERASAEDRRAHTMLVTSEHLWIALQGVPEIARLRELLGRFDDHHILCLVRPQVDAWLSGLSTGTRVGAQVRGGPDIGERFVPNADTPDFAEKVAPWIEVWGRPSIDLVPFARNRDSVAVLCDRLGLDPGDFGPVPRVNARLDHRTVALGNHLDMPRFLPDGQDPMRFVDWDVLPVEQPLTLGREAAAAIHARFAEANRGFVADWPALEESDLAPALETHPERGTVEALDDCDFAPMTRAMVRHLRGLQDLALAEIHLLRSKERLRAGRAAAAVRRAERAERLLAQVADVDTVVVPERLRRELATQQKRAAAGSRARTMLSSTLGRFRPGRSRTGA